MHIRPATVSDIATIQHVASLTWPVAYADILSPGQMGYMLNKMYSARELQKQMEEDGHLFFIAEQEGNAVGYAGCSLYTDSNPVGFKNLEGLTEVWKLHKLYVLPGIQKTGTGKALMQKAIDTAISNNASHFILNVNRHNPAYQYYLSKGFEVIEEGDFEIGAGFFMNDYAMVKRLA